MKVRDLITQLLQTDMDDDVFIGLGDGITPTDSSVVLNIVNYGKTLPINSNGKCPYGVYIIPSGWLHDHCV